MPNPKLPLFTTMIVQITTERLDITNAIEYVSSPKCGAIATFIGTVRNENEGKNVTAVEYTAFKEMAEKEMKKIVDEALNKWKLGKIYLVHRIGKLVVGEASVIIAVSSAHRAESFEACRSIIETLKQTVPIWKKEHF